MSNIDLNSASLGFVYLPSPDDAPTIIRYDKFVEKLFKIMSPEMMKAHAVIGVCGEAGELADAIKREIIYGKTIDRANVVEELGDLRFFMQATMNLYGITEQEVLQYNGIKLQNRYKDLEYSDKKAQDRADKVAEPKPGSLPADGLEWR